MSPIRHLGDVTKINGAEIEKVDCITFGAPCQDLSVAGKRKGMQHEGKGDEETTRSGLFYEAIRIIKEMREDDIRNGRTDDFIRPRWTVYENVPGALSSNSGDDFRCVLEETARLIEEDTVIPGPPKGGWPYAGSILVGRGSIAWKIHDAQYHGVPQRRKRVCVLADLNGWSAADVLFAPEYRGTAERTEPYDAVADTSGQRGGGQQIQPLTESVSRHSEPSKPERETAAGDSSEGIGEPMS